jgi:ribonuclease VapC
LIVDTSALFAIVLGEPHWEHLLEALSDRPCRIPATTLTELNLAASRRSQKDGNLAEKLIDSLLTKGVEVIPFEGRHALLTRSARTRFGKGNGKGGLLNFGDLMVYAIAKDRGEPLLCTGRDFASTDIAIHPASRIDS